MFDHYHYAYLVGDLLFALPDGNGGGLARSGRFQCGRQTAEKPGARHRRMPRRRVRKGLCSGSGRFSP
ncbi:MAG: hypothetical protein KGJ13_03165 [Patescibacteria group bacterium]|nr:hypothetical protein [Patescibacteria group bacterium]